MTGEQTLPESVALQEYRREVAGKFVSTVSRDLCANLPAERHEEIRSAERTAVELVTGIGIQPEYLDVRQPGIWEQGVLVLGIADVQNNQPETVAQRPGMIAARLACLFPESVRNRLPADTTSFSEYDSQDIVLRAAIRNLWPECTGDEIDWVREHVAVDSIVTLPCSVGEALRKTGLAVDPFYSTYVGFAYPKYRVGFVGNTVDEQTVEEEREHAKNDNLFVGNFGHSLNEGVTNLRVNKRMGMNPIDGWSHMAERYMVHNLTQRYRNLDEAFNQRYELLTQSTALNAATAVIGAVGLAGHQTLYAAHIFANHPSILHGVSDTFRRMQLETGVHYREDTGLLSTIEARDMLLPRSW